MRTTSVILLFVLLPFAAPALAEDAAPTPAELARMIHAGKPGELLLVEAWLDQAERAELIAVFEALRELKAPRPKPLRAAKVPKPELPKPELPKPDADGKHMLVNAELRILDIDAASAAAFLGAHRPTAQRQAVKLTAEQAQAILGAANERKDVTQVTAPRITVFDGQKANVSVLNQVSYVRDYEVEVTKDGKTVADPIIDVIQEGAVIDFTPTCGAFRKSISFDFNGTFATIQRPIPDFEKVLEGTGGRKVTIQIPEVRVARIRTSVTLRDGSWVLLGGGIRLEPAKGKPVERVTLVHLKTVRMAGKDLREAMGEDIRLK